MEGNAIVVSGRHVLNDKSNCTMIHKRVRSMHQDLQEAFYAQVTILRSDDLPVVSVNLADQHNVPVDHSVTEMFVQVFSSLPGTIGIVNITDPTGILVLYELLYSV